VEGYEERQVGIGGSLVEPFLSVGPAAGASTVGQVAVEDKREGSFTHHHLSGKWTLSGLRD